MIGHIRFDLCKILRNIHICIVKFLLCKLGNFSCHKTLFVLEKAIRASEKAIKRYDLLKESQLRVRFLFNLNFVLSLLLTFNCSLDRSLDLGVYLCSRLSFRSTYGFRYGVSVSHRLLDQARKFLNVSLVVHSKGFTSKDHSHWNYSLGSLLHYQNNIIIL